VASTPERVEKISSAKEELYRDLIRKHGMKPLPGVRTWLHRLHEAGWLQAIASAAPRPNIDVVLEALSATHLFQSIVSADDVHHGKPDPEVYLIAAAGVEGARRAGMRSIGISRNGKHLPADIVVRSLELLDQNAFEALLNSSYSRQGVEEGWI
jgi:beta-phosphoglucomutase-like phosphatase (HAD superfamily)